MFCNVRSKVIKVITGILLSLLMLCSSVCIVSAYQQADINVVYNNRPLSFNPPAIVRGDYVFFPIEELLAGMCSDHIWNPNNFTVIGVLGDRRIEIPLMDLAYISNGFRLDVPGYLLPFVYNERTYVYLDYIALSLGFDVQWNETTKTIYIFSDANQFQGFAAIQETVPVHEEPASQGEPELDLSEQAVYQRLIALKTEYPAGMTWTNETHSYENERTYRNSYDDSTYSINWSFFGCQAFAEILSLAAFGNLPVLEHTDFNNIRVGDIVEVNWGTHAVVVLAVSNTHITVAEGNFSRSVSWDRQISIQQIRERDGLVLTRYP
jgi:hypothetical protein